MELTILMPCLNEEHTVAICVTQALQYMQERHISGEVLVVDNRSEDASAKVAAKAGARVVICEQRGYGSALLCGIRQAYGTYVIMGDCDCSYDFSALDDYMLQLRNGAELVMGNRFAGRMEKGAMPLSHRFGVPILSWLGRVRFSTNIKDFHCGLRGVNRESMLKLGLKTSGMEFATEMIGRAAQAGLKIAQVPIVLHKDQRKTPPHLRTIRDGIRHVRYIFFLK